MQTEITYTSRVVANRAGAKHYLGMICVKHPDLSGKRSARNGNCCGCNKDKMRARRAADPEYFREQSRASHLKRYPRVRDQVRAYHRFRKTGIDQKTYDALYALQDGKCALCFRPFSQVKAHADHCHDTKRPRGILCINCNQAEGIIKALGLTPDEFGKRLSAYIANPPAEQL